MSTLDLLLKIGLGVSLAAALWAGWWARGVFERSRR